MACACNKGKKPQYEVITNGKSVYTSTSRAQADGVSKKYKGSTVREKPTTAAKPATTTTR